MSNPTTATVKRLFALSSNNCAFPKCNVSLVDAPSGKVTGRICHIKGRNHAGARYDASQSQMERHDFNNLILLCPIHHDVVDDDEESYTVERLTRMKAAHEAAGAPAAEPSDEAARQLIANISQNTINHGSIIFTQHQLGGQVAHSINNFGPQPRQITPVAANVLVADLRRFPPEKIKVFSLFDPESFQLASVLKDTLSLAGWNVEGVDQAVFNEPVRGVVVEVQRTTDALMTMLHWVANAGLKPDGVHAPYRDCNRLIVGANV